MWSLVGWLLLSGVVPVLTNGNVPQRRNRGGLFGIVDKGISVRGGGLFGGKKDAEESAAASASATISPKYPAMSQEEVEDWLSHIPVFAVTDANGSGVVLKPDNESSVFYFFMSHQMANATLNQLKGSNADLDLQVSAFSLGKIWFRILQSATPAEVKLKKPGDEESVATKDIEYRLVPDTRDLMGARMLLTMDPKDGEALKNGGTMSPEMAQAAIQKAMTESPKFNATYNEIPVFMIQQMRMQKQVNGTADESAQTILPMYFNLQSMVALWQQFTSQQPEIAGIEPSINLMDLFDLVAKMQTESEIDFRNVVLVPSTPSSLQGAVGGAASLPQAAAGLTPGAGDPFSGGGTTLGDI